MLILKVIRPNTVGVTLTKEFESYSEAEDYIERRCEKLADRDWELTELTGSTSKDGTIECTHDYEADIMLITWETV